MMDGVGEVGEVGDSATGRLAETEPPTSKKRIESTYGGDISKWGHCGWGFLHPITLAYPQNPTDREKAAYKAFFEALAYTLPCPECQRHYQEFLAANPLSDTILTNTRTLSTWLHNLHNDVRARQNKQQESFWEMVIQYEPPEVAAVELGLSEDEILQLKSLVPHHSATTM